MGIKLASLFGTLPVPRTSLSAREARVLARKRLFARTIIVAYERKRGKKRDDEKERKGEEDRTTRAFLSKFFRVTHKSSNVAYDLRDSASPGSEDRYAC